MDEKEIWAPSSEMLAEEYEWHKREQLYAQQRHLREGIGGVETKSDARPAPGRAKQGVEIPTPAPGHSRNSSISPSTHPVPMPVPTPNVKVRVPTPGVPAPGSWEHKT